MDVDEFLYAISWRSNPGWAASRASLVDDALQPLLNRDVDYGVIRCYSWARPVQPRYQLLTESFVRATRIPKIIPKSIVKPERVSLDWVHLPTNCYGRKCARLPVMDLEFAHIRWPMNVTHPKSSWLA